MKRFLVVLLVLLFIFSMAACTQQKEEEEIPPAANTESATSEVTIEGGNVVATGKSEYYDSRITYVFENGAYSYTLSETEYKNADDALTAYNAALAAGSYQEVVSEGSKVSFKADDSYIFEGMSASSAAQYVANSVIF